MKTIWYYTITQNKRKYLYSILMPAILLFALFVTSVVLDRFCPSVNNRYMKWPDMVKDLLGLSAWNSHLYVNLWQLVALVYPICHIYDMMTGLARSVIEEDRLETIVYLHNLSIGRKTVMGTKALVWMLHTLLCMLILFFENLLFFLLLHAERMIWVMGRFYIELFTVSLLYMTITLFIASFEKQESSSYNTILAILIFPLLLARLHAVLQFLKDLLTATGRGGNLTDQLAWLGGKVKVLEVLSPVAWCWPGVDISGWFVLCGLCVGVVMLVAADFIYSHRDIINME